LNNEDIQDKILGWIAEKDLEILKVSKTERTNFILTIKSKEKSILNFPINVASSKKPEVLILGFTGIVKGADNRSFLGTDKEYREKMLEELADRARLSNLRFFYSSNSDETRLRGMTVILPNEITKDRFFRAISSLTEYRKYLHHTFKKYKFARPTIDNYGI
jgi:hypothetical protein